MRSQGPTLEGAALAVARSPPAHRSSEATPQPQSPLALGVCVDL